MHRLEAHARSLQAVEEEVPMATAGVSWPARSGTSSPSRQSADSASIIAVSV
ncbi:MAG: hypothetical protein R2734_17750 [Nocardioides sp.]